jgi:hypothetical protein
VAQTKSKVKSFLPFNLEVKEVAVAVTDEIVKDEN